MTSYVIQDEYFDWLVNLVCGNRFSEKISYRTLLSRLHDIEFIYVIPRDQNRADDGMDLRYRFALTLVPHSRTQHILDQLDGPCSVLEMMIALSIRCEECIMDDPTIGDRTGQWFWGMIANLGLNSMMDHRYDGKYVDGVIDHFMYREYDPDGRGGLFRIKNCDRDLRDMEIWHQLCYFLEDYM